VAADVPPARGLIQLYVAVEIAGCTPSRQTGGVSHLRPDRGSLLPDARSLSGRMWLTATRTWSFIVAGADGHAILCRRLN